MEKNYYFVLEPGGSEDGPYQLNEIGRRLAAGLVSSQASLCRAGETHWEAIDQPRFRDVFARIPPPLPHRAGTGTLPPIDVQSVNVPSTTLALRPPTEPPVAPPSRQVPRALLLGGGAAIVLGAAAMVALFALRGSAAEEGRIKDAM